MVAVPMLMLRLMLMLMLMLRLMMMVRVKRWLRSRLGLLLGGLGVRAAARLPAARAAAWPRARARGRRGRGPRRGGGGGAQLHEVLTQAGEAWRGLRRDSGVSEARDARDESVFGPELNGEGRARDRGKGGRDTEGGRTSQGGGRQQREREDAAGNEIHLHDPTCSDRTPRAEPLTGQRS